MRLENHSTLSSTCEWETNSTYVRREREKDVFVRMYINEHLSDGDGLTVGKVVFDIQMLIVNE